MMLLILTTMPLFAEATENDLNLTEDELNFIEAHPTVYLAVDPQFYPYEFFDTDGEYKGIAADYLKLISERTGINFVTSKGLTWTEAYEMAATKQLDMLGCVLKTTAREAIFNYSKPYYNTFRVIYISDTNREIKSFEDLKNKRVAVQTNSSHHSYLQEFPDIELVLYETVSEALAAVSDGREDAFVGNFATSSYLIKSEGITNLNYVNIEGQVQQGLHFAVRNDWPLLVSILDKALADITSEERIEINNTWIGVEKKVDYSEIIKIAIVISVIILAILIVSLYWIMRMRKEVALRRKIEAALQIAKDEAEQANLVKSTFLARMSHEIRTPLHAISGMSYILKKTSLSTTQQIYLDKISRASKDMLGIINDILDFSKIESGNIEIERVSFNIDDVLEQLVNIISYRIGEQQIDFSMHKDPQIPNFFWGDPTRLEQILINLVSNAIKFTKEGEVSLSIRLIAKVQDTHTLEFSIKDTGIGMTPEQLNQLFKPFSQADASISRRFGGTGLGLSIVKSFVDMMGGRIKVYSEQGVGSTFNLEFEFEEDRNKEYEERKKMAASYFQNIRALVVESSFFYSNLLKEYLDHFNIIAEFAKTDERAIQMLENASAGNGIPFNLILIDYETPKDHGIAFFKKVKSLDSLRIIPKSILLVPISREDLLDALEVDGIDLGISKPIVPSVLYNGILELFKINVLEIHDKGHGDLERALYKVDIPYHILVVDDNNTNQFIAKSLLEQAGYEVSIASNGKEGYQFFSAHIDSVDLILMDLHMPVMNGYEATSLIREIDGEVPIIAMTADAITGVEEKCKEYALTDYISKPFEPDVFLSTISNWVKARAKKNIPPPEVSNPNTEAKMVAEIVAEDEVVLDTSVGLKYLGGNQALYKMVLTAYRNENTTTSNSLKECIEVKNYSEAIQIVHKIKGSSANIGATKLYALCIQLQQAFKENDVNQIEALYITFDTLLAKVIDSIDLQL